MSKHMIKGVLVWEKTVWKDEPNVVFFHCSVDTAPGSTEYANRAVICEHSFEVDVPDNFDPTAGFIAELTEQKRQLRLKLAAELAEIDDRISKLQALPMPEEA